LEIEDFEEIKMEVVIKKKVSKKEKKVVNEN
jgi:hypothetical protein